MLRLCFFNTVVCANPVLQVVNLHLKQAALECLEGRSSGQPLFEVFKLHAGMPFR